MMIKYSCIRAGVGVRSSGIGSGNGDAIILLFGFQPGRLSATYSYDITTSSLSIATGGSHEIALSYRIINKNKPIKKMALNTVAF